MRLPLFRWLVDDQFDAYMESIADLQIPESERVPLEISFLIVVGTSLATWAVLIYVLKFMI